VQIILKRGFNAFSGLHEGLVLLKNLSKPPMRNRTYMMKIILKSGFNAFSGLHEGLVLLKDLPKPSMPNRTYMMKIILKVCLQFTGPTPHGFTWGLVLLKDLPKTTNTIWYFHAQNQRGKGDG
jgi:hypothetical protein